METLDLRTARNGTRAGEILRALRILQDMHVPVAPVLSVPEAMAHPHLIERQVVRGRVARVTEFGVFVELERAGLPTVQVSTMTPVAVMVGANRIVPAAGIIHPLGNAEMSAED